LGFSLPVSLATDKDEGRGKKKKGEGEKKTEMGITNAKPGK